MLTPVSKSFLLDMTAWSCQSLKGRTIKHGNQRLAYVPFGT